MYYNKIIERTNHNHKNIDKNTIKGQALINCVKRKTMENSFVKAFKLIRKELKTKTKPKELKPKDINTITNDELNIIRHGLH